MHFWAERGIADPCAAAGVPARKKPLLRKAVFVCLHPCARKRSLDSGTQKKATLRIAFPLRRERDSNPRRCDPQRFSRPPHSTALPSLRFEAAKVQFFSKHSNKNFSFVEAHGRAPLHKGISTFFGDKTRLRNVINIR